ncbi:hypothetical protein FisN_4Lh496 [Fistulifera solaris]|uniref:CRAL-TRIO domain-containing protein n=1 Tax=Fistulifera solaris TaxID=1519565 RepID=A0A1Z5KE36_FISSO|nr:hypothetical protein FisN_4Lh496 [Fistulifera solaris]|eukprot:GAX24372.1 hypothetical protein FisN_4Lh496 [Fistulifera solaris]
MSPPVLPAASIRSSFIESRDPKQNPRQRDARKGVHNIGATKQMKTSKLRRVIGALALVASFARSNPLLDMLDSALLYDILEYPGNFSHREEEESCEKMVHALTLEEQEIAARTSHAYWLASLKNEYVSAETRLRAAKKEARRHLVAEKGKWEGAVIRLKEMCRLRKEKKLDLLRQCFVENAGSYIVNEEDRHLIRQWEEQLQREMTRQATWVSPNENNQHAILHRSSRTTPDLDEEAYHLLTLYATEHALATSELLSKGQTETCTLVLYFENYLSDNMPPLSVVRTSLTELQLLYPERITKILVLNPPRWLRITYRIVSMFLSSETRNKVGH